MANEVLRRYWHPAATSVELEDQPLAVRLLDEEIVLFRAGGRVIAFQDRCIHRGTRLSLGWIEGETLVCPYHGWTYAADGRCVRIPSLPPERAISQKARVVTYHARERYGLVWVCLDEPRAPLPDFPEIDDPGYRTYFHSGQYWKANAARMIENFIDISHFPWVHPGLLGDRSAPRVSGYAVERQAGELHFEVGMMAPQEGLHQGRVDHYRYRVILPFAAQFTTLLPSGGRHVASFVAAPLSAKEIRRYLFVSRDFALDEPDDRFREFGSKIIEQDRVIVESQRPEELPLDLSAELHLKGPDDAAIQYRRALAELGLTGPLVA